MLFSTLVDQNLLDISIIIFALIYNLLIILVFIFRATEQYSKEERIGPIFVLLIIPFLLLLFGNLMNGSDIGRIGTIIPMLTYLLYDIWYRQITRQKPKHHPEKMPKELIIYIILFYFAGMAITGYAFIVSKMYGYIVLTTFMLSIVAYFYYQISFNKRKKLISNYEIN